MENPQQYDFLFKVVIVGESGVGKSSLLVRYVDHKAPDSVATTIGVDFKIKTINVTVEGITKQVKLQIWDTAGQERFQSVSTTYYRGSEAALFVFDLTNIKSLDALKNWIAEADRYVGLGIRMLIGNKCDSDQRNVRDGDIGAFCSANDGMVYLETSALTGQNVEEAFRSMATTLVEKKIRNKLTQGEMPKESLTLSFSSPRRLGQEEVVHRSGCCGGAPKN